MKKLHIKRQCILLTAVALTFSSMPLNVSASEVYETNEAETTAESTAETNTETNTESILETSSDSNFYSDQTAMDSEKKEVKQIVYTPGGYVELPTSLFEKGDGRFTIYAEGFGALDSYYPDGSTIHINFPYDKDVKKGVYPLTVTFEYTKWEGDSVLVEEIVYDDVVELIVEEDMQGIHLINTVADYDGSKDVVFHFKNGTGDNRIVEIKDTTFWADDGNPGYDDDTTYGFSIFSSPDIDGYYSYDLDKGEFTIKKEYFETRIDYYGWLLKPWVFSGGISEFVLANGQSVRIDIPQPEAPTLTSDFVNPGDDQWYLLYNVKEGGNTEITDPVEAFVERLYTNILDRTADPSGLKAWTDVLKSGKEQGAKVAQGFIESPEFQKRKLSDEEYLEILYQTFFDRKADSNGLKAWLKVLDSGLSRMHVFKGFAESNEFTEICEDYGIIRGNVTLTAPMDQNEGVTKFIARCYKLCLGRKADPDGLNGWCNQILTGKNTAKEAAHGFVFSDEFKKKNLSDKAYVQTMYRVFMDREADPAGLNAWVNVLKNGQSREHVFNGFADSNEFKEICAEYGIR